MKVIEIQEYVGITYIAWIQVVIYFLKRNYSEDFLTFFFFFFATGYKMWLYSLFLIASLKIFSQTMLSVTPV